VALSHTATKWRSGNDFGNVSRKSLRQAFLTALGWRAGLPEPIKSRTRGRPRPPRSWIPGPTRSSSSRAPARARRIRSNQTLQSVQGKGLTLTFIRNWGGRLSPLVIDSGRFPLSTTAGCTDQ
jgi:hypothetical protein